MNRIFRCAPLAALFVYLLSGTGCSKSTDLGLSLVEQDPASIFYTADLDLPITTVELEAQTSSNQIRTICGALNDPIFGRTEARLYMNFRLGTTNASFPNARFDSIVLMLVYDTIGHYGDVLDTTVTPGVQEWEVFRMEERIENNRDYTSKDSFLVGALLGTAQFVPRVRSADTIVISEAGNAVTKKAHLRITLDPAFGEELLKPADPTIYNSNDKFKNFFKGVYIRPKDGAPNTCLLRFRSKDANTKISMYYTDSVSNGSGGFNFVPKKYDFTTTEDAETVINIQHDYTGTSVLDNTTTDSIVYLQGMNGVGVRVDLSSVSQLGRIIVNKAELEIYAIDSNSTTYPPVRQLLASQRESDGSYTFIDDVITSFTRFNTYTLFGGVVNTQDPSNIKYTINISQFLQRVVDDAVHEKSIYLQTASIIDPNRVRLGNHLHSAKKLVLKLTYTDLN